MDQSPVISVVIASFSGIESLERCLASLRPWDSTAQVIVASNLPAEQLKQLGARFGDIRIIQQSEADVFALRAVGVKAASAKGIAMTEDHVTFEEGWVEAIVEGLRQQPVVGGPIDNGLSGLWDWALFACEYITFLPAGPRGAATVLDPGGNPRPEYGGRESGDTAVARGSPCLPAGVLSGVNVAYRRELLEGCSEVWRESFHENEVHDALHDKGHELHRIESAGVSSHLKMTLGGAMDHLFGGARHYGRYRKGRTAGWRRRLLLPMTLLVPAVLLKRIFSAAVAKRPGRIGTLLLGLPLIGCLITAWTCGEALGYLSRPLERGDAA